MEYDFSTLSPHDFELLAQDLLQRDIGCRLEGFKSGRDGGVDLRRAEDGKLGLVVQCKHFLRSGFAQLKRTLRDSELPKVEQLAPARYVVVTSCPLSAGQRDLLVDLLTPHCRGSEDIYGAEDLNALLRSHPEVEQTHFKLWVASTTVLQAVLHNDLFARRYLETEAIRTRLSLFVPTDAVSRAQAALSEHGFCVLSGIPGIGKTTTAEMLVALMLEKGWECVFVRGNADEAMRAYDKGRKQVFLYDDFLGKTSLSEKLEKNEDSELVSLMRACGRRPNSKRLLLTTRDYLLAQAMERHEALSGANLQAGACVIELADYTRVIRAQILVNHLWFFGVRETWCRKLVRSGVARQIVDHKHYSPRLVEAVAERTVTETESIHTFPKDALKLFDDPSRLWRKAYENQLSDIARELMVCFASLGDGCFFQALRKAHASLAKTNDDDLDGDTEFLRGLRELEGTFVNVDASRAGRTVSYHNPSVKDFMDRLYRSRSALGLRVIRTAVFYNQLGYAARHVLRRDRSLETQKLVAGRLADLYQRPSATPERIGGEAWRPNPVKPAQRLLAWRRSHKDSGRTELFGALGDLAVTYLSEGNYLQDDADDVVRLAEATETAEDSEGWGRSFDRARLMKWLWANLRSLDDFQAAESWLSEWSQGPERDSAYDRLRSEFSEFASTHLDELASDSESTSEIEEGVDAVKELAEELGVSESELDFWEVDEKLERLEEEEQEERESGSDDWGVKQREEAEDDEAVDDILDSLR